MGSMDTILKDAVMNQDVLFVVAMSGNREGVTYSGAAGEAADGRAVEKVDGRRIDHYYREEIFKPLGMTSTAFEVILPCHPTLKYTLDCTM